MNAQPIRIATIKKWEAISCDRLNHALVVYQRDDGLFVVDVFEVTSVFENLDGIPCLQASSLSTKYNRPDALDSAPKSAFGTEPENVVEIPLSSIVESHRYRYGTGFNDLDIRRYYESVSKVRQRKYIQTMSRSTGDKIRFPEITKSSNRDTSERIMRWMGCLMWLLYTAAFFAFAMWIF